MPVAATSVAANMLIRDIELPRRADCTSSGSTQPGPMGSARPVSVRCRIKHAQFDLLAAAPAVDCKRARRMDRQAHHIGERAAERLARRAKCDPAQQRAVAALQRNTEMAGADLAHIRQTMMAESEDRLGMALAEGTGAFERPHDVHNCPGCREGAINGEE